MESLKELLFPKIFVLSHSELCLLGVGAVDLCLLVCLFKYNLIRYKDTLFVNDQITQVLFPVVMSG